MEFFRELSIRLGKGKLSEAATEIQRLDWDLLGSESKYHVAELARLLGMGVRRLHRVIKKAVGLPPKKLLESVRHRRVVELLLRGNNSTKVIAYEIGFSKPSPFCRAFRRSCGKTPGQFKEAAVLKSTPIGIVPGRVSLETDRCVRGLPAES